MVKKRVPKMLWYYVLVWICETVNLYLLSSKYAKVRTAIEIKTGRTHDIIEYLDFSFYDCFTYRNNSGLRKMSLGRLLGVSNNVRKLMSYLIITSTGHVISATTSQK